MFITFEGADGTGKTTQAKLLAHWLESKQVPYLLTKEPGSVVSKECKHIRSLLLDPENDLAPRAEFFLYLADRAQHVTKVILPALENKQWVISDRYSDSTYVYQGWGRGLENIADMISFAAQNTIPDLTFIMDLPVEIGLSRARSSNIEFVGGDRIENETIAFHKRLKEGFLYVYENNKDRCILINAEKSVEEIHEEVKQVLHKLLDEPFTTKS